MIPRLNMEAFSQSEYVAKYSPVIITDGLRDWSAQGKWSPDLLCSFIGECRVKVGVSRNEQFNFKPTLLREEAADFSHQELPLEDAAKIIANTNGPERFYLMQQPIREKFPQLLQKITIPQWIPDQASAKANLWFGAGSVTQLHYDGQNNFFAQLHGTKQFILFPPQDTFYLYPFPLASLHPHTSFVDPDQPDEQRHPLYAQAHPLRFAVQPGELLFLPAFWWHWVKAAEVSISVNFWWQAGLSQYIAAPNSVRIFYQLYATDRLQALQKGILRPKGLDFFSAAELLLRHRATWAAGMLVLAAFDQVLSAVCSTLSINRPQGCAPCDLPAELAMVRGQLPSGHQLTNGIETATLLAGQIQPGTNEDVNESTVRALMSLAKESKAEQHDVDLRPEAAG